MRDQLRGGRAHRAGAHGDQHEAILRRRRGREGALEVGLQQRDDAAGERADEAHGDDGRAEPGDGAERGLQTDEHVGAGGDHGRRVQQGGDRRWALHG